ncbi:MAG TPA: hypothetical protein VFE18_04210 [Phenylobacterium sp.]|jgi:hypothetical protein|uniref:hypothetical protein n=1 Tax=Phenylobacterium sp. TaxID=1871053 RepID=UPI002D294A4C|nr:hypothetical protein [Phenylobacterium sp.]HZZ67357.1 hypothetical protein [Phenylobacterium sp.]
MSDTDRRFDALWEATEAPAHDLAFALAVEARVVRRLMLLDVAGRLVAGAALLVLAVAFAPMLAANAAAMVSSLDAAGPALAAAAVVGAVILWLNRPPAEA